MQPKEKQKQRHLPVIRKLWRNFKIRPNRKTVIINEVLPINYRRRGTKAGHRYRNQRQVTVINSPFNGLTPARKTIKTMHNTDKAIYQQKTIAGRTRTTPSGYQVLF